MASEQTKKEVCKFGDKCYRKNADHLKNYDHSPDETAEQIDELKAKKTIKSEIENISPESNLSAKVSSKRKQEEILELPKVKVSKCESSAIVLQVNVVDASAERFDLSEIKDLHSFVTEQNQMEMPNDFYDFLDFCKSLSPSDPKSNVKNLNILILKVNSNLQVLKHKMPFIRSILN